MESPAPAPVPATVNSVPDNESGLDTIIESLNSVTEPDSMPPATASSIPRRFSVISLVPLPSNTAITGPGASQIKALFGGEPLTTPEDIDHGHQRGSRRLPQCIAVFVATIGSFGLGTVLGWTAPAVADLRRASESMEHPLGTSESSWIASLALLGALFSGLISGQVINRLGRRRSMLLVAAPLFLAGWALIAFAQNYPMIFAGRFVTGYAGGTFPLAVPIYVSEVTDDALRGVLGSLMVLMLVIGMLFSFAVGSFVGWSQLSAICGAVPVLLAVGLLFVPESPRYLLLREDEAGARKALVWLRGEGPAMERDFELLKASVDAERNRSPKGPESHKRRRSPHAIFFTAPVLKPTIICILLMFFQQFGGINGIISYTVEIFQLISPDLDANLAAIILAVLQVVVVVASMVLVDRVGRKILLIGSEIVMCVSLLALGAFFYVKHVVDVVSDANGSRAGPLLAPMLAPWLPFVSLVVYIVAYSVGMGPVPWLLTMELLHPAEKGTTTSCVTMSYWLLAFVSTKTFEDMATVPWIGWHGCYWAFAAISLVGIVFIWAFIPETKGRSTAEIQKYFSSPKSASTSTQDYEGNEEDCDKINDKEVQ